LPEDRVYMLDTDTTVELIAAHMADKLKVEFATDTIRVKAYEGVGKGAIAER
ncbi:MAG TPA: 6-pyruvoyl tetrahydropterin reductase, partial [Marinobacter adhaerens]|nr:6-pyruvoyl tetrahydropterin reductase [Marinobacter adhaerens]